MSIQPHDQTEFHLSEIAAAADPSVARHIDSLIEYVELTEEKTVMRFCGFELRRWRRIQRSRRRRWTRWTSVVGLLVIAIAGILKLWILN